MRKNVHKVAKARSERLIELRAANFGVVGTRGSKIAAKDQIVAARARRKEFREMVRGERTISHGQIVRADGTVRIRYVQGELVR